MQGPRVRLVLVGTEGEINLGFIARLAANYEVDEVYLVSPQVDPRSEEVRRFAAHGAYMVDRFVVVESLDEALRGVDVAACTSARVGQRGDVLRHPVSAREFAEEIAPRYERVAVVFGRESVGLTRDEIAKCHLLVHIPASPSYPVLNLSHAVAIILYELWMASQRGRRLVEPARSDSLERIYSLLAPVAEALLSREHAERAKAALRHLLWRCPPTAGEASALYQLAKRLARLVQSHRGEEASAVDNKPGDRGRGGRGGESQAQRLDTGG